MVKLKYPPVMARLSWNNVRGDPPSWAGTSSAPDKAIMSRLERSGPMRIMMQGIRCVRSDTSRVGAFHEHPPYDPVDGQRQVLLPRTPQLQPAEHFLIARTADAGER